MNLLFLGGKRFFGNKILNKLSYNKNYNIFVVYRKKKPKILNKNSVNFIKCERNNINEIKAKLNKTNYQIIFDNNCYNYINFKNIIAGLKSKNFIYIFISSIMTYIYNHKSIVSFDKNIKKKLSIEQKKYINEKKKIENHLIKSNIKFIIFILHNIVGKNDHSKKTNFLFNLRYNDLKKFKINNYDRIQFAFVDDIVKIIYNNISNLNFKLFKSKVIPIANKPFSLKRIINVNKKFTKYLPKKTNFNKFPWPLNFIIRKKDTKYQKHTSLEKILKKI